MMISLYYVSYYKVWLYVPNVQSPDSVKREDIEESPEESLECIKEEALCPRLLFIYNTLFRSFALQ